MADSSAPHPLHRLFRAHPWHGIAIGDGAPAVVTVFIEIVPADTVKYEIDKATGHLKVDRPQQFSNICPTLYGFLPQTYCGDAVAKMGGPNDIERGDGDPLDICVLTEKSFSHGDFLLQAIPIGGLRMVDHGEADDKIIAVLKDDVAFGHITDLEQLPAAHVERLKHYFLTYKRPPTAITNTVSVGAVYGSARARGVIEASRADYRQEFRDLESTLAGLPGFAIAGR
jgi:inorganic pyrophosphatase